MISLIDELPSAPSAELISAFVERLQDDVDYVRAALRYLAFNTLNSIEATNRRNGPKEKERLIEAQAAAREVIDAYKEQIKMTCIADFVCPNGKALRDNTGIYVHAMGGRFARIGKAAGRKIIGKVLKDQQIQKLWAK